MTKIVLVSLVHNRGHLVGAAIQSALNQTLSKNKWIHLLVDNGSIDFAKEVCKTAVKKHSHIRLIRFEENLGQQPAFNYILNEWLSQNELDATILVNLDSDDELKPNALEEVEKMFDAHPEVGQIYSGFDIIDGKGAVKIYNHPKAKLVQNQFTPEGQRELRKIFVSQNPVGHLRAFKISALREIGGFNTEYQYATDYNVAGRMFQKFPVVKIDKVLYRWRQHGDQIEGRSSGQQTSDYINMQNEFKKIFKEMDLL